MKKRLLVVICLFGFILGFTLSLLFVCKPGSEEQLDKYEEIVNEVKNDPEKIFNIPDGIKVDITSEYIMVGPKEFGGYRIPRCRVVGNFQNGEFETTQYSNIGCSIFYACLLGCALAIICLALLFNRLD